MIVSFLSFDENHQKTSFQTEVTLKENIYQFLDKTCEDTTIFLTKNIEDIILDRKGSNEMHMHFQLNKTTKGNFKNHDGLEFDFLIKTQFLKIESSKIKIRYYILIDEEIVSEQSVQFSFFNA